MSSLDSYTRAAQSFCEARDWDQFHSPKELAIGLVTESAELLELFRFLSDEQSMKALGEPEFRARVGDELGDALFFLVRFSQRFGFDLVKEGERKLGKSGAKYPADKYRGVNRKVFDEG
jgi:NTP pyrophosphatase (non-canonical NTP hydrolase)